jgi:hypothetical protein
MAREPGEENVNAADGGGEVRVRPATDGRKNSAADPYSLLSGLECYLMRQNDRRRMRWWGGIAVAVGAAWWRADCGNKRAAVVVEGGRMSISNPTQERSERHFSRGHHGELAMPMQERGRGMGEASFPLLPSGLCPCAARQGRLLLPSA